MTAKRHSLRICSLLLSAVLLVGINGFRVQPSIRRSPLFSRPSAAHCASNKSSSCFLTRQQRRLSPRLQMAPATTKQHHNEKEDNERKRRRSALLRFFGRCLRFRLPSKSTILKSAKRLRRAITIFVLGVMMSNSFLMVPATTSPAFASTTATDRIERVIPKGTSFDKMVDRYVLNRMFDDDVYDPVESTLREIVDDQTTKSYPVALKTIEADVYGKDVEELLEKDALLTVEKEVEATTEQRTNIVFRFMFYLRDAFGVPVGWSILASMCSFFVLAPYVSSQFFFFLAKVTRKRTFRRLEGRYGKDFSKVKYKEEKEVKLDEDDDDDDDDGNDGDDGNDDTSDKKKKDKK